MLLQAAVGLVSPLLSGYVIDVLPSGNFKLIATLIGIMVVVAPITGTLFTAQQYVDTYLFEGMAREVRVELIRKLHRAPLSYFRDITPGEMMNRIEGDINNMVSVFSSTIIPVCGAIVNLAGCVIVMFSLSWQLALTALCAMPVGFVISHYSAKRLDVISRDLTTTRDRIGRAIFEAFSFVGAMRTRLLGSDREDERQITTLLTEQRNLRLRGIREIAPASIALQFLAAVIPAAILLLGSVLIFRHAITIGSIFAFLGVYTKAYGSMAFFSGLQLKVSTVKIAFERILQLLDLPREHDGTMKVEPGALQFDAVTFRRSDRIILQDFSCTFAPGDHTALLGASGEGKSTIAHLALCFESPDAGEIRLGGVNVGEVSLAQLRQTIGFIPQEPYLSSGSVRENLLAGDPQASDEELWEVLRLAHVDQVVRRLPAGLDTSLETQGFRLSGGERQRIALARALLRRPRILLLDETTASLDTALEQSMLRALKACGRIETIVLVTHRLTTARVLNRVVYVADGRVAEEGRHEDLVHRGGMYAQAYASMTGADVLSAD